MNRIPGQLPWMLTLISPREDEHEFEFFETEEEANQGAKQMIEDGLDDGSQIYISKIVSQNVVAK